MSEETKQQLREMWREIFEKSVGNDAAVEQMVDDAIEITEKKED